MQLEQVTITNFRSITGAAPLTLELGGRLNLLTGRNNCGKSNVLRAITAALDPSYVSARTVDGPAQMSWSVPTILLTFSIPLHGFTQREKTLLRYAEELERSVLDGTPAKRTYAQERKVRLEVKFDGSNRRERIVIRGGGNRSGDPKSQQKVIRQLRDIYSFVLLESGQSLESMLTGRFSGLLSDVLRSSLGSELEQAIRHREDYVDKLRDGLLAPLRDQVVGHLKTIFPEVEGAELTPMVSAVEQAVSEISVQVADTATTSLLNKGTGIRGSMLIAMLRYIAAQSRESVIFAVEEPEAFLHPGAQRSLARDLLNLSKNPRVSLLATTHSPFMLDQADGGLHIVALEKDKTGRTTLLGTCSGIDRGTRLIEPLFGDLVSAEAFGRQTSFDVNVRALLLVEGEADVTYLRATSKALGIEQLLKDIQIEPLHGATKILVRAAQIRAVTDLPVVVLLDGDATGKKCADDLQNYLGFRRKSDIVYLGALFPGETFGPEAEDVFDPTWYHNWVKNHPSGDSAGRTQRRDCPGTFHYELSESDKRDLAMHVERGITPAQSGRWGEVIQSIDKAVASQLSRTAAREARAQVAMSSGS